MRVELLYKPGCKQYRKTLEFLQTVIAEERLPIPVELQENSTAGSPQVRVNGESIASQALEDLRSDINVRWSALTTVPCR